MPVEHGTCTAQVGAEGRIVISAPVRRHLNLEQGDFVRVDIETVQEDS